MVQFGKQLHINKIGEWSDKYIDYDGLKKKIKQVRAKAPSANSSVDFKLTCKNKKTLTSSTPCSVVSGSGDTVGEAEFFAALDTEVCGQGVTSTFH